MSQRIDKSWVVFASIENDEHDRCVDIFSRPDATFGFEEFRRDVEDGGAWTAMQFYSRRAFGSVDDTYDAAEKAVGWLNDILGSNPKLRRKPQA
ncbi:MAG: hypothetical protein ABI652_09240 [Acidobacteriota bacterium]